MHFQASRTIVRSWALWWLVASTSYGAGGALTLRVEEESDNASTISRVEIWKTGQKKLFPIRRAVPAGIGVVLDRSTVLELPNGGYRFRMIRGPEYRIITGSFSLEDTSLDEHAVQLPRIVDMRKNGWTSGDCCVVRSPNSLPLRMASEDLHVASSLGHSQAKPIPHRKASDRIEHEPIWIRTDAHHDRGLVYYAIQQPISPAANSIQTLVAAKKRPNVQVGIENPFAWELPVWLASQQVDGFFLLGDWLRLDRKMLTVTDGKKPELSIGGQSVGLWAEEIYRNVLDSGISIPPLAGGGSNSANTPVGYNRLYVAIPNGSPSQTQLNAVQTADDWWTNAWLGHSVATNGPLLRPFLNNKIPGHVFRATHGETLELQPELKLATRDPVDYLEVIHNNRVHYSARLDEFAKAGGKIPPLLTDESGWVLIRVVTLFEDHYRAAVSAPWYVHFDDQPRVSKSAVRFFQKWLGQYEQRLKKLPRDELETHVPFIQAARRFWANKERVAVD